MWTRQTFQDQDRDQVSLIKTMTVKMLPDVDRVKDLGVIIDSHLTSVLLITSTKLSEEHSPVLT